MRKLSSPSQARCPKRRRKQSGNSKAIENFRSRIRYLALAPGLFSSDGWAIAATFLGNTVGNWLLLAPVLACAVLIPWLLNAVVARFLTFRTDCHEPFEHGIQIYGGVVCLAVALLVGATALAYNARELVSCPGDNLMLIRYVSKMWDSIEGCLK